MQGTGERAVFGITGFGAVGDGVTLCTRAIQAACDGLGVAVGIRPYVDDDIRAGRLVAPFPLAVPMGRAWFLHHPRGRAKDPAFAAFARWLTAAARAAAPGSPVYAARKGRTQPRPSRVAPRGRYSQPTQPE